MSETSGFPFEKHATGQSVSRLEDPLLLRGEGCFTDDFNLDRQAYGYAFRSPFAHGRIDNLDVSAARASDGVLDIETLPAVTDCKDAAGEAASQLHAEAPGNQALDWEFGDGPLAVEDTGQRARIAVGRP